jgi:hypothetical protein
MPYLLSASYCAKNIVCKITKETLRGFDRLVKKNLARPRENIFSGLSSAGKGLILEGGGRGAAISGAYG